MTITTALKKMGKGEAVELAFDSFNSRTKTEFLEEESDYYNNNFETLEQLKKSVKVGNIWEDIKDFLGAYGFEELCEMLIDYCEWNY